jgi:hypothetical protein
LDFASDKTYSFKSSSYNIKDNTNLFAYEKHKTANWQQRLFEQHQEILQKKTEILNSAAKRAKATMKKNSVCCSPSKELNQQASGFGMIENNVNYSSPLKSGQ